MALNLGEGEAGSATSHSRLGVSWSRCTVPEGRIWMLLLIGVWVASVVFVARHLNQGWVPHDDGSFAQSAQRVLEGQLPHRDFTELYTGGLTFLNAAVFALFGENLIWLRIPMFLLFVVYVPCVYAIARRFAPPLVSLLAAAFAVAWGPVTYPAAVPSWYLLFFSVFGALALLRHLETRRAHWLVVAGVFGGLSISFKIVGIWYVIAVLFFLVFVEQETQREDGSKRVWFGAYGLCVAAFACVTLALVVSIMHSHLGGAELVNFIVPVAALAGLIVVNEAGVGKRRVGERFLAVARLVLPFSVGVATPIVLLLIPYLTTGSVADLITGVFISPQSRLEDTYVATLDPGGLLVVAPLVAAIFLRSFGPQWIRRTIDVAGIVLLAVLLVTSSRLFSYSALWVSARAIAPLVVFAGAAALVLVPARSGSRDARPNLFLLLALAAFSSLVQFPFGAPIYYCYVAALFALAAIAALRYAGAHRGLLPAAALITYTLFGFAWLDRSAIYFFGASPYRNPQTVILDHSIASIRVTPSDKAVYREVVALLRHHTSGPYTYAGPDTPELYFLSGLKNPTRSLFDVLDSSNSARGQKLLATLRARHVGAIVINLYPRFSDELEPSTLRQLRGDYPMAARVGPFDVRWRTPLQ